MIELKILFADQRHFPEPLLERQNLSISSAEKLAGITAQQRRHQFLLGRWLLAYAIGSGTEQIEESAAGYPVIVMQPEIHASLSHSGPYVGIVVCKEVRCGLDIEYPTRQRNWLALAERAFHPIEQAWIAAEPACLAERFHAIWTLREAAFKAGLRSEVIAGSPVFNPTGNQAVEGLFWHHLEQAGCFVSVVAPRPFSATLLTIEP